MTPHQQDHVHALTSLRFFAAFYVLVFHSGGPALTSTRLLPAPLENFLANGYLGVTFFFVLSGFILTYVYHGKLTTPGATTRFAVARFARVYPVCLLSMLLMMPFVTSPGILHALPQFLLLQSWIPLSMADGGLIANWNMQAWTLSVELFFYLMFPWLLRASEGLSNRRLGVCLIAVCLSMILLRLPAIIQDLNLLYEPLRYVPLPLLRAPEFVYGVLLGVLYRRGEVPKAPFTLCLAMGLTVAVLSASKSLWIAPVAAVLFGGVIALVPTSLGYGMLARVLNSPLLVLLGGASYALYLLQLPVHSGMRWLFVGEHELAGRILYIPMLVIVSILVFLLFEEKMRELIRARLSPRSGAITRQTQGS